jgi:hypothetical protein
VEQPSDHEPAVGDAEFRRHRGEDRESGAGVFAVELGPVVVSLALGLVLVDALEKG